MRYFECVNIILYYIILYYIIHFPRNCIFSQRIKTNLL